MAAAVLIFLIALDTTPIADDYGEFAGIMHAGTFQYLHSYWVGITDRYSNAALMVVLVKLFGTAAIHIAAPLLLALLLWFCVVAARAAGMTSQSRFQGIVASGLVAITIAVAAPDIFDASGWFNSVTIYLAGLVATAGTAAWIAHLAARRRPATSREAVASFFIGLIAAGFTELAGIVIALGSLLALANLRELSPRGPRRRALEIACAAIAAGAAIGVIVIFVGPGTRLRAHLQHGSLDPAVIANALRGALGWAQTNAGWRVLLSVAVGVVVLHLRGQPRGRRSLRWLVIWALFLCCVPMVTVGVTTGYSGLTLATSRTAWVATASIAMGEALVAYVIAAAIVAAKPMLARVAVPTAAVAVAVALLAFQADARSVIRAERLRRTAFAARAMSIRRQLRNGRRSVAVAPLPLIDPNVDAYDLRFGTRLQFVFVLDGIRAYYRIPRDVRIHVIETQPLNYCLPHVRVGAFGVKPCSELAPGRRARS
ncbi:MAG: hypothetical protein ACRDL5_10655 [Solirubrobacteraceae bacterium]